MGQSAYAVSKACRVSFGPLSFQDFNDTFDIELYSIGRGEVGTCNIAQCMKKVATSSHDTPELLLWDIWKFLGDKKLSKTKGFESGYL